MSSDRPGRRVSSALASSDGRSLYVEVGKEFRPHLVDLGVPLAERRPVPLPALPTGQQFAASDWSPDGRWIVGQSYSLADGSRPPLYLFDPEKKTYQELVDLKATRWCAWLPDSRRILLYKAGKLDVLDRVTRAVTPAGSLGDWNFRVALSATAARSLRTGDSTRATSGCWIGPLHLERELRRTAA